MRCDPFMSLFTIVSLYMWSSFTITQVFSQTACCFSCRLYLQQTWIWCSTCVRPLTPSKCSASSPVPSIRPSFCLSSSSSPPTWAHAQNSRSGLFPSTPSVSAVTFYTFFLFHMSFIWKLFLQLPSQFEWVRKIMHSTMILMIKHLSIYL